MGREVRPGPGELARIVVRQAARQADEEAGRQRAEDRVERCLATRRGQDQLLAASLDGLDRAARLEVAATPGQVGREGLVEKLEAAARISKLGRAIVDASLEPGHRDPLGLGAELAA